MSNIKIASPLYILREKCSADLMGVLERLAEIGYDGIEFLGFFGHSPEKIRAKLDSCGLKAVGNHVPFDEFVRNTPKIIGEHAALGCGYITIAAPSADRLPEGANYPKFKEEITRIGEMTGAAKMKLLFHNHSEEMKSAANGKSVLENIMDDISPSALRLEPDLGWMQIGGGDPFHYLKKYGARAPVIHFKDYFPLQGGGFEFRPSGYGIMDNAALFAIALEYEPEWLVADHDCSYARDEFFDMKLSLDYLKNLAAIHSRTR